MHRCTTPWAFLFFAFTAVAASGCTKVGNFGDGDGVHGSGSCKLGTLGCLCDSWGGCDFGLQCVRDRCEPLGPSDTGTIPESGAQSPGIVTSGASQTPDTDASTTSPEPGDPDSETSPSSSGPSSEQGTSSASSSSQSSTQDSCKDGLVNSNETDVDCGGPACPACEDGRRCIIHLDCVSQNCRDGSCVSDQQPACIKDEDCQDDSPCTQDRCVAQRCQNVAVADGTACNDQERCTIKDRCLSGRCTGQDTRVFYETFSNPDTLGFELDYAPPRRLWQAGTARVSGCSDRGYVEDPGKDHTQDMANGVLGVDIGGCSQDASMREMDCAWTRYIDVSFFDDDLHFSFWRHVSSPGFEGGRDGMRVRNFQYYRLKGDSTLHRMKTGWPDKINDRRWTFDDRIIKREEVTGPISFGICYRRLSGSGSFAGWSVDDVKVRQIGCEPRS